jgi:hypothetical protein
MRSVVEATAAYRTYDDAHRLIGAERGNFVSGATQELAFERQWGPDAAGNFAPARRPGGAVGEGRRKAGG